MLPISEFPFTLCGIATVAASLGYACARRAVISLASPNEPPSKADVEPSPVEERSLKRKLDDADDEHSADTEPQSRPMKRNRTPPTEQHESDTDSTQEWEVIVAPTPSERAASLLQPEEPVQDNSIPPNEDPHSIGQDIPSVQGASLPHPENSPNSEEKGANAGCDSTPLPPQANLSPNEPETLPPRPITPPKPVASTRIEPVKAFSTFSGSSSPFGLYSNASGTSPFALSGQIVKTTPAWRCDNEGGSDVFGRATSTNPLALSSMTKPPVLSQSKGGHRVPGETQSLPQSSSCLTGEEDESIDAELKGVKLFLKRGPKEFTDGMYGHIKILSEKPAAKKTGDEDLQRTETETTSRTRLLFRRDPLGQVSMNVGLRPTIRCHFDSAENILRIIAVEQVVTDGKDSKEDIVIYALKPGRAQKADFQSFSKTLCDHDGLKPRAVASSVSDEAAAS